MKTPTLTGRLNRNHPVFSRFRYLGVIWLALIAVARAVVDTPTASPNGTYATFLSVNVSCTTQSAKIYYTVNGGPPTTADHLYGTNNTFEGIQNSPVTLTFKAFLQGVPDGSDVTTRTYTFTGQVSTSGNHTLVLLANGTVWAAGKNDYGQLGDGTTISQIFLKQVPNLSNVVAVAAGGNHSLALLKDGTVKAWGLNTNWQCGASGGTTPQLVPNSSNPLTNVTRIAAGATHSVALTSAFNGTVYTWGGGANGQQGNGTYTPNGQYGQGANVDRATPGLLSPSLTGIKDIASGGGGNHTLALTNAGSVYCWGSNAYAQCGNGSPSYSPTTTPYLAYSGGGVLAIAAGSAHSLAVKADRTVLGWGQNLNSYPSLIPNLAGIKSIAAGDSFTLAVKADDTVVGFGSNYSGELGNGTGLSTSTPVSPSTLGTVMLIAAGSKSSFAITPDGNVFAWGSNSTGALGLGVSSQKNVPIELLSENINDKDTIAIAAGGNHNLVTQKSDSTHPYGSFWAWGSNSSGQLGAGNTLPYAEPHEALSVTPPIDSINPAAAGFDFSLVVKSDGTVAAAGQNTYGQLGRSLSVSRSTTFYPIGSPVPPNPVPIFGSVAAGRWHGLALTSNGADVFAWGYGSFGQLGNGTTPLQQINPTSISALKNAAVQMTAIAAGQYHSMVRKIDGSVWAWGQNTYGQVGNANAGDKKVPNWVGLPGAPLNAANSIAAGWNHNLAVKSDLSVASWGYNSEGQLGDNTTTNRTLPITVKDLNNLDLTNVTMVAAGYGHSLALKGDGTVWAWGRNVEGQLGDGTNVQRKRAVQVLGLSGIVVIAAGDNHNLAAKGDGGLVSWGSNNMDQLGTGLSVAQLRPLIVPGVNVLHGVSEVTIVTSERLATEPCTTGRHPNGVGLWWIGASHSVDGQADRRVR